MHSSNQSPSVKVPKIKLGQINYTKIIKVQKENNALRDFIGNFHLQKKGDRVVSSLYALSEGTTYTLSGKVQRYFNQLEDYVTKL